MKKNTLLILTFLFAGIIVKAQGLGINTDGSAPNNSAMLDVSSTTKGFLPPRMTTAQRSLIPTPAEGLIIYNTDEKTLNIFNGNSWGLLDPLVCGKPFNDSRDGKTYNTVIIGSQCWMKENLNIGLRINSSEWQSGNGTFEKYCNGDNESNCDVYGGLYQWNEMMQYSETPGVQGICPTGWHLPTQAELATLIGYLGGSDVAGGKMKETGTTHWISPNTGATNSSGFTGLPGGMRQTDGSTTVLGITAHFWSSSKMDDLSFLSIILGNDIPEIVSIYYDRWHGMSVRCVKNN